MKTDWQNVHSKVQEKRKKVTFNTMQIIAFGFLGVIFLGSILLYLPISNQEPIAYLDALFVSVSAVCVTGLVTVFPAAQFTLFGKAGADPDRRTGCHRMYDGGISGNSQEDHHEEQGYDPADIQSGDVERNGTVYYPDSEGNSSCRGHRSGVICVSFCS